MGTNTKDSLGSIQVEDSAIELTPTDISRNEMQIMQKVYDGDEALKYLHAEFEPYTEEEERQVRRKIDRRMVILMLVVNGLQFVDKNVSCLPHCVENLITDHVQTISAAATYGIITEAQLVGQEFSLLITLFYIGYLVAQYPTNLLMQRYPIGKYITVNFILWGKLALEF
jgi:ACS family allantoate permease-like MFS transporter